MTVPGIKVKEFFSHPPAVYIAYTKLDKKIKFQFFFKFTGCWLDFIFGGF
jgi:hypothetical protein